MTQRDQSSAPLAPDFYDYLAAPIAAVTEGDDALVVSWSDGRQLSCHRFWLRENTLGHGGIDPATREGIMDPAELSDAMQIAAFELSDSGDLRVTWAPEGADESVVSTYHSGWLRHIAEGQHLPESWVPAPEAWNASTLPAPPRRQADAVLKDDDALCDMLNDLLRWGVCVVEQAPSEPGFLNELAARIGPVRDSNFGLLWDVKADVNLAGDAKTNTTANTGFRLGPHTDLPTREIPPGFQFLHCLINEADGGESTLTDGAALIEELKATRPDDYEILSTRRWVFFNRGPGIDHRFSAPIIDPLGGEGVPTIRAFYPVRAFPDMPDADVGEAYAALRRFHALADHPQFELTFRLGSGDIMCFDNRRIMHGRKAFQARVSATCRGCILIATRSCLRHGRLTGPGLHAMHLNASLVMQSLYP